MLSYNELKSQLWLLVKNNRLRKINKSFINRHNDLVNAVCFYTEFLNEIKPSLRIRMLCILKNLTTFPKCVVCKKIVKRFTNLHDFNKFSFSLYCSQNCNAKINNSSKWPIEKRKATHEKLREIIKKQRQDGLSEQWCLKLSKAASKEEVKIKKATTNLIKYGVNNPGVLGAYSSKSATLYIEKFIKDRNIEEKCCLYKNDYKHEFFQWVFIPFLNKKRCVSYDLVVFENELVIKDVNKIKLVLEYNGPWHYTKEEIIGHELENAVPYRNNTKFNFTKKESYLLDKSKLFHISQFTSEIFIYNVKNKQLIKFSKDMYS